jgi:pantoate--beta-alanine ligase
LKVLTSISEARSWLARSHGMSDSLGLVPTMGALHDGHLSLIKKCKKENKITAVSIFVNPTQFNDESDFKNYPRNFEKDFEMITQLNCDIIFAPDPVDMYPDEDRRIFDFGNLDKTMEGVHRPGHFNGVAQIVSKLLSLIKPQRAYFGEKDFQQLAIIRSLVKILKLPVEIVACPTIRESDGLAMSSRNELLSINERKLASIISRTLFQAVEMKNKPPVEELKDLVTRTINSEPGLDVEYFAIIDSESLSPLDRWTGGLECRACIAVRCGQVRLIDNMNISY